MARRCGIVTPPSPWDALIWELDASAAESLVNAVTVNGGIAIPTVTRAGANTKTRVNSAGLIEIVPENILLRDFDPVTLAVRGFIPEEARTNLLLRSAEFDNASWVKTTATVTANVVVSPDGGTNAEKVIPDAAAAFGRIEQATTLTATTTYTVSIFAKAAEWSWLRIRSNLDSAHSVWFNLATGTIGVREAEWTSARITNHGNGWYRCDATYTTGAGTAYSFRFNPTNQDGPASSTTGDGVSGGYMWGSQIEAGAFPTSYIPTTSATVTRTADVATLATSLIPGFSAATFSMYGEFYRVDAIARDADVLNISDGSSANRAQIGRRNVGGANSPMLFIASGAVGQTDLSSPAYLFPASSLSKTAAAVAANDAALTADGQAASTDATVTMPVALTTMRIGAEGVGSEVINAPIRKLRLFNRRLSNAELQAMTA